MYKEIEHTADLAIEVSADSIENIFSEAARGMFYLMYKEVKNLKNIKHDINLDSFSNEYLLVDFLNELLYINETREFVFSNLNIQIKKNSLNANVFGYDEKKEKKIAIKAATYHNLEIVRKDNIYRTQITFDV